VIFQKIFNFTADRKRGKLKSGKRIFLGAIPFLARTAQEKVSDMFEDKVSDVAAWVLDLPGPSP
jgi:hypothetical protein